MKFEHEFKFVFLPLKNGSLHKTNLKSCKYCNFLLFTTTKIENIPNCISDDEKVIKDILE